MRTAMRLSVGVTTRPPICVELGSWYWFVRRQHIGRVGEEIPVVETDVAELRRKVARLETEVIDLRSKLEKLNSFVDELLAAAMGQAKEEK
jgi:hypothetical protein